MANNDKLTLVDLYDIRETYSHFSSTSIFIRVIDELIAIRELNPTDEDRTAVETVREHLRIVSEDAMIKQRHVEEMTMLIKRLGFSLRRARPDSKLPGTAMEYLKNHGLIGVEDVLR